MTDPAPKFRLQHNDFAVRERVIQAATDRSLKEAASLLGCSYEALKKWLQRHPDVKKEIASTGFTARIYSIRHNHAA